MDGGRRTNGWKTEERTRKKEYYDGIGRQIYIKRNEVKILINQPQKKKKTKKGKKKKDKKKEKKKKKKRKRKKELYEPRGRLSLMYAVI